MAAVPPGDSGLLCSLTPFPRPFQEAEVETAVPSQEGHMELAGPARQNLCPEPSPVSISGA